MSENKQGWLSQEKLLIGIGILLPFLVIVLFLLASTLPRWLATPPQHDLLFTSYGSAYPRVSTVRVNLDVHEGRARARVYRDQGAVVTRLFRFDHTTSVVREIPIPIPDDAEDLENGSEIPVPELEGLHLEAAQKAPDGYEFRGPDYQSIGLVPELLGMSRRRRATIVKNGAVLPIQIDPPLYSIQFLAWVTGSTNPGDRP